MKQVCEVVVEEPGLGPVHGPPFKNKSTTTDAGARADILARGFFEPQIDNYWDCTIVDTGQKSALKKGLKPETVLAEAQREKRDKYEERIKRLGGSFTPFAASVFGTLAPDAERTILTLMKKMSKDGNDVQRPEDLRSMRTTPHPAGDRQGHLDVHPFTLP